MFEDLDPFTATPSELLSCVVDMEPGPMAMSVLLMIDRAKLAPEQAVTFVQVHERQASWWASVQVHSVVAAASGHAVVEELLVLDSRPGRDEERLVRIADACREEMSSALRISAAAAQAKIDAARLLVGPLAHTALRPPVPRRTVRCCRSTRRGSRGGGRRRGAHQGRFRRR